MSWETDDFVPEEVVLPPVPVAEPVVESHPIVETPVIPNARDYLTGTQEQEIDMLIRQGYKRISGENMTPGYRYVVFHATVDENGEYISERNNGYTYTGQSYTVEEIEPRFFTLRLYETNTRYIEKTFTGNDLFFELPGQGVPPGQRGGKSRKSKGRKGSRKARKSRKTRKTRKSRKSRGRK